MEKIMRRSYFGALLLVLLMICMPLISASTFGYNKLDNKISTGTGNIINYYNVTQNTTNNFTINATVNETQFDSNSPISINISWLTNFITDIITPMLLTKITWGDVTNGTVAMVSDLVNYNSSGLIIDWNSTGLIQNWTTGSTSASTSKTIWEDEFQAYATARANGIGSCGAVFSGTAGAVEDKYIGVIRFSDSVTANGGFACASTSNTYFQGGEKMTIRAKVVNKATNFHLWGWNDGTGAALGADYCVFLGRNLDFSGTCKNNTAVSNTSSSYTLTTATWYTFIIEATNSTYMNFSIWNANISTMLWSDSIKTYIPNVAGRSASERIVSFENTTSAAAIMSYFDYIKVEDLTWT